MNPIAAITQIGSLVGAVRSLVGARKTQAPPPAQPQPFSAEMQNALARFIQTKDADGNGSLSLKEFGGGKDLFAKLDVNHDGQLSREELLPLFAPPQVTGGK